ncbi:MAG: sugar ABC transporter substrate-binding protein [Geminicoccaceae bacterium]
MKKTLSGLALSLSLALTATNGVAQEKLKIGFAPPVYDTLDYFGQFAVAFEAEMERQGVAIEFTARASASEASVQQQLDIVDDLITLDMDYIIVGPIDYFGIVPALQAANEEGVPIIVVNHLDIHPDDANVDVLAYSGYSHAEGGEVTANWALGNVLAAGDKVGLMFAEPGNQISEARVGTARDIWTEAGVEVGFEHYAYWEQAKAFDATERLILANPEVKAVYAGNSNMAMGVAGALDGMGRSDVSVFGFGAIPPELDMVWEGKSKGSIFRDSQSSGRYIADAIARHSKGETIEKQYPLDMVMVSSREDILTKVPEDALRLMENWPEVEKELANAKN